jgi:type VII secretion protein EccB
MATRTDQLQSYQFMTQRVISAFVMRETDPLQSPLRRGIGAVFGGLMIAILVGAGFGVYGILTKVGSDAWKTSGSVVIEKETGATYVYVGGTLHPTLNLASAMLAAGQPNPSVFRVASNSLDSVPRGTTVGIAGAPDSLPSASARVGLPWTVCAVPDSSGSATAAWVGLAVSREPTGGKALADEAVLVKDAKLGMTYLIWHGRRHLVQSSRTVVQALFGAVNAVPVGTAWLNAIPAGVDIGPIRPDRHGEPSAAIDDRRIGDVLVARTGSGPQYYLVLADGLSPITALQHEVLGAIFPMTPAEVDLSFVNSAARSARERPTGETQPPAQVPTLVQPGTRDPLCAITAATPAAVVQVGGPVLGLDTAAPTTSVTRDGVPLADRVLVPAGRVAVIRVVGAPGAGAGSYFIVTDTGIKYPVVAPDVLALLGYSAAQAIEIPDHLAQRIPTGPTLDPAAAIRPALLNGGTES